MLLDGSGQAGDQAARVGDEAGQEKAAGVAGDDGSGGEGMARSSGMAGGPLRVAADVEGL